MYGNREEFDLKNKNEVCRHPKPFSGHSFNICFTTSKPLKRSIIPTSRVPREDTSDGKHRGNRFIFIYDPCDPLDPSFLLPMP